jgi:polysaccharide deacetylase family protein (PEP-CTERM system associated)
LLSFDFEDWPQLVGRALGNPDWDRPREALPRQAGAIFGLLDELGVRATFFVLGMTAETYPELVREIAARGHEVACHGHAHRRVYAQSRDEFAADVERSVETIERLTGRRPAGYRAPAFSINRATPWAYDVLAELGFRYDSSAYDSPRVPDRMPPRAPGPHRLELASGRTLWELPPAVWRVGGRAVPVGGGAYWRVLPAPVLVRGLGEVAREARFPALYFHPYECDPERLRAPLPAAPTPRQRAIGILKSLQRNPGRGLVPARIRKIGRQFRFTTYEEACAAAAHDD